MSGERQPEHTGVKEKVVEEFKVFWIITLYLASFLGAFTFYRRLVLAELGIAYLHYGFAFVEALIIAKVILIGRTFSFTRRFEDRPLFVSVAYKTCLFAVFVVVFSVLEHLVEGLFRKQDWGQILHGLTELGADEILARMLMLVLAFIPFFAFWEIGRVLGPRKLSALFFSRSERPSVLEGRG